MQRQASVALACGIPSLDDFRELRKSPLFSDIERFSDVFVRTHRTALKRYRWSGDPFRTWSRQWEYPFTYSHIQEFLRSGGSPDRPVEVLDAGSGVTFFPFYVASCVSGAVVRCCDSDNELSRVFADVNAAQPQGVAFHVADLHSLPYGEEAFDVIYCVSVLEHTEDYDVILQEFERVLRPNGILILTVDLAINGKEGFSEDEACDLVGLVGNRFKTACQPPVMTVPRGWWQEDWVLTPRKARAVDEDLFSLRRRVSGILSSPVRLRARVITALRRLATCQAPKPTHRRTLFCVALTRR